MKAIFAGCDSQEFTKDGCCSYTTLCVDGVHVAINHLYNDEGIHILTTHTIVGLCDKSCEVDLGDLEKILEKEIPEYLSTHSKEE